jgi:hypothetical protein
MILEVFYRDEFDILELTAFHASKFHFIATLSNGEKLDKGELKDWIQIKIYSGSKLLYNLRNSQKQVENIHT